jgi:hypothetical protein
VLCKEIKKIYTTRKCDEVITVQTNAYRTNAATVTEGAVRIQSYRKEQVQGFSCSLEQQSSQKGKIKLPATPVCCGLNFEVIFK